MDFHQTWYIIDIVEIWFGVANGQISSNFYGVICLKHAHIFVSGLLTKLAICIDIIKIWFRIVICPSVIFFSDIFATITLIHKQIIAMAGYYACGAFILSYPGVV